MSIKLLFGLVAMCVASFCPSLSALPNGVEYIRTLDGIQEYKLNENGLRILLMPDKGLPVATVMVTYEIGSRNEVTGTTGSTHILEHMMFKGTRNFNSDNGTDYSNQMERIGARSNATTYFDRTNYYATLPSEYVPLAIELEADRMRNLRIYEEDLASEMTVVRNEYERGENNPVRTLIKELYASAFIAHPYGHPTIGWLSDIESTSTEKLRKFYNTYYWPENAVLSVIGGFDTEATLEAIKKSFSAVPKAPQQIPGIETIEPAQTGPRRLIVERAGQVGIVMLAFKAPAGASEDWAALSLIEQIMGADKTGRLYRALEDKGKASATFTYAPQLRDPSLFTIAAYMTPEATHKETEQVILDEIKRLVESGVTREELQRAKSVIKASTVYGRDGSYAIANQLNEMIAMGDWTQYATLPKAIQNVKPEDIQRVAKQYFTIKNSTTGWFVPQKPDGSPAFAGSNYGPIYYREPGSPDFNQDNADVKTDPVQSVPTVDFSSHLQTKRMGDIEVIAIDMPIEEVVSFAGSFAAGETFSPKDAPALAALTAEMLDKGTKKNDRFAIAEQLNSLGAEIQFAAGTHSLNFSGKFLRDDAGAIMSLLAEQLREPAFDAEVLETLKSRQTAQLLQAMDNPEYRAAAEVSRLLYPEDHPNYINEIDVLLEDLKATTIEDIAQFHSDYYGTKSMQLVFAGDIDFEQLAAAVESAFDGWDGGVPYPEKYTEQLENACQTRRIEIADKTSVAVCYAQNTGLSRTDDDYLPFMIGNYILGGSFQSRLMQEVRKEKGLTYSIRSSHSGDILTPGNWLLNASFSPNLLEQGLAATESVVEAWHRQGIREKEVHEVIETLCGAYLVGLSTTGNVAHQTLSFIQRGFAPDYIDEYPQHLRSVTAEEVNNAIRKYINPGLNSLVMSGSFVETQEPEAHHNPEQKSLSVSLDTPSTGWRVDIKEVYRTSESIVVISQLENKEPAAATIISTVSDTAHIPATDDALPVRHYILGKTWDWSPATDYTFIDSMDVFGAALDNAEQIYKK